jgi:hypothetical protein
MEQVWFTAALRLLLAVPSVEVIRVRKRANACTAPAP